MSISKKRGGLSQPLRHRVTNYDDDKGDGYPLPNDWVEAVIVFIALAGVFGGVYGLYALSQV